MTGARLEGIPTYIGDRQAELEALYAEIFPLASASKTQGKTQEGGGNPFPGANLTDEELLAYVDQDSFRAFTERPSPD